MSKKKPKTSIELAQTLRRDWGGVKPYTRVLPNDKAYSRKEKHKHQEWEQEEDDQGNSEER